MNRVKKIYLLLGLITGIFVSTIAVNKYLSTENIEKNELEVDKSKWTKIIARDVNNNSLSVIADGILYSDDDSMYMNDNMELMVSLSNIKNVFDCSENIYGGKLLSIQKGENKAEIDLETSKCTFNGKTSGKKFVIDNSRDEMYLPISIFKDYFGYDYEWDGSKSTVTIINLKPDERTLPYYYSYADEKKSPMVRMQGNYGTCWAFASLTALESTLLPEEDYVFAVDHMVLCDSFAEGMEEGGDYNMSMAYLASWQGPVLEKDDPYDGTTDESLKPVKHVQEMQIIEPNNFQKIKEMVYKYGGVQSSLYTSLINSMSVSSYYNRETYGYCYMGENKPNHDIVIIGWDDNYPKENFNAEVEGDGAFICRSSWGEEFGDKGNFYVSYYDSNIGVHNMVYTKVEDKDNYDRIYQSDLCGWVGNMGYKNEKSAYFANVYTASSKEKLEAVSFYVTEPDTSYEIYVVSDFDDVSSLTNNRVLRGKGIQTNQGYYTIKLDEPVELSKNQKFAVVVKATTPKAAKPIPVEFASEDRGKSVTIEDGEGYMSLSGTNWENTEKTKECNICLKAFTNKR